MKFAVLISGKGTNLQAILDAKARGAIDSELAVVISNKEDAFGLERAKAFGVETVFADPSQFDSRDAFDQHLLLLLSSYGVDFVVLAGYMRILSDSFIDAYEGRLLNIHPSLLPQFKGAKAIREAFETKVSETGATVHFVVKELDSGPIILQKAVSINSTDTLEDVADKIHAVEHDIYPEAIHYFEQGRLHVEGQTVVIRS